MRLRRIRRVAVLALAASLVLGACTPDQDDGGPAAPNTVTSPTSPPTAPPPSGVDAVPGETGTAPVDGKNALVGITLGPGKAGTPAAPPPVVDGDPLDPAEMAAVTERLPEWIPGVDLTKTFNWPTPTKSAPPTGKKTDIPFPAPPRVLTPPAADGPLHVLRSQPQGIVSLAPFVSITFDQAMVPITTVGQLAAADVPATISPAVPGHWQWIGTRTLRFDADSELFDRLPMATKYTVTVPAGTKSATGTELEATQSFSFTTPAVSIKSLAPTGKGMSLNPVFVAVFNQQIDPAAVLKSISATAGGQKVALRLATDAEVAADSRAAKSTANLLPGRWIAFRAVEAFGADTPLSIVVAAGVPSAEGPLTSTKETTYTGRTYAPLAVTKVGCGGKCLPGSSMIATFNNKLDPEAFDPAWVTVTPEIPNMVVNASGKHLYIDGSLEGRTDYRITVGTAAKDVFGQQLSAASVHTLTTGTAGKRVDRLPQLTTLDPFVQQPTLILDSVNRTEVRVRVFAVDVQDWPKYQSYYESYLNNWYEKKKVPTPDWPVLLDETVAMEAVDDQLVATPIDLTAAMADRDGKATRHVVVLVEPTAKDEVTGRNSRWENGPTVTWAQRTSIGLDAMIDASQMRVWATDLSTGEPLSGVTIGAPSGADAVTTTDDGVATIDLDSSRIQALVATKGDDTALVTAGDYGGAWQSVPQQNQLRWLVNDDRQTYRPGETASIKGWVRLLTTSGDAQIESVGPDAAVTYIVRDGNGVEIGKGKATLNTLGGFDLTVEIPAGSSLGQAWVEFTLSGATNVDYNQYQHYFQIADFRRPDFEVDTQPDSKGPYVVEDPMTISAEAQYYAGGPLGAAPINWQVRTAPATYAPPGWDRFSFGIWTPWWDTSGGRTGYGFGMNAGYDRGFGGYYGGGYYEDGAEPKVDEFAGSTDADGKHYLQVQVGDLGAENAGLPVTVTAQATVTDVNRQALAGSTDLLVHPADYYVGLSSDTTFVRKGQDLSISAIVTDVDGAAAVGRDFRIRATLVTSSWATGTLVETESAPETCDLTSAAEPVLCTFHPTAGGTYKITGTVVDDKSRTSRSELTRWVGGANSSGGNTVQQQALTLVPNKAEYTPGESAEVLVSSPIATGTGLVTYSRNGITSTSTFEVVDGSAVLSVPVQDKDLPNINLTVEVVGATPRAAADDTAAAPDPAAGPLRPALATATLSLAISPATRELTVIAKPQAANVAPGADTKVDVTVQDNEGNPVSGSEFEVMVVDEAVLSLSDYTLPDPNEVFYAPLYNPVTSVHSRETVALTTRNMVKAAGGGMRDSGTFYATAESVATTSLQNYSADMAMPASAGQSAPNIKVRQVFDALAVFKPTVLTDAEGKATIDVPLPESLTRYRVMVVAVAGATQFGTAEANITASLPLTVRPTAPRFLNFGDTFELPVLVQNLTGQEMTTDVVVQTDNLELTGVSGKRVTVPANGRVEVRFPVSAAEVGTARFRVAAVSGDASDATTVELPVYTPATSESFATYGVLEGGKDLLQPVLPPTGVIDEFGGLTLTTSTTALSELTDALTYLTDYRYESSDGLASQIMAIASLQEVLAAFKAPGLPAPEVLKKQVADKIELLSAMQNTNGGFPYWKKGDKSEPFNSIQVAQALVTAKAAGYELPDQLLSRALNYLKNIKSHISKNTSASTRDTLLAYALNVRKSAGTSVAAVALELYTERGPQLSLDALAWLWPTLEDPAALAGISTIVNNAAVDKAGSVNFTNKVVEDAWTTLQSDRRTDALILDALIAVDPKNDLIPKIVAGLRVGQVQGRWDNVQENSFTLLGLKHYFDTLENVTPDLVARAWLGERFAGEHTFTGHSTDQAEITIPTAELLKGTNADLTVSNDGTGRLYYRIGLQTAPADFDLAPLDRGFVVSRTYEAVGDAADVTRDADGTWHIKAGAQVRVNLSMVAESRRTHVALIDALPAGLEILNPDLATTPKNLKKSTGDRWSWSWFDHQNLRDDRAEAFSTSLGAGVYDYSYVARATTLGSFVVPPPRAEEIYSPETFGRGASDAVVVEK